MTDLYCVKCKQCTEFSTLDPDVHGEHFSRMKCNVCSSQIYMCSSCSKAFTAKHRDRRPVRNHISDCHPSLSMHNEDSEAMDIDSDLPPLLRRDDLDIDDLDIDVHDVDMDFDDITVNTQLSKDSSMISEVDYDVHNQTLGQSFTVEELNNEWAALSSFGNHASDVFYEQDFRMFHWHAEPFAGIRGVCWRSRYRIDLSDDLNYLSNVADTRYMFNILSLLKQQSCNTNELFYEVMSETTKRTAGDFDSENPGVAIPRSENDANRSCLEGRFGMFRNLPCPTVHDVGGHACMKIGDILHHHFAQGRGFEYTEDEDGNRNYIGIHGSQAMTDLLEAMKQMGNGFGINNGSSLKTCYGWITTWSDSFLRSYVKQKRNNVWMYTITLPDPNNNGISPYHTYCVGVGPGFLDHTAVIDWYSREVAELMKGRKYYCAASRKFVNLKIGVVAVLADRPEKAFMLKTALLGTYGKIASWAAEIDPTVLPDCNSCFTKRISSMFRDDGNPAQLPSCRNCCQWDLSSESQSRKRIELPYLYPRVSDPDSPPPPRGRETTATFIKPVRQTFAWLTTAVNFAAHNVRAGLWKKGPMVAFLRTCSIAESVRDNIWTTCKPSRGQNATSDEDDVLVVEDGEIVDGYGNITSENSPLSPILWHSQLMMSAYLDCGMHLVFHGIVARCVEEMEQFMSDHSLKSPFNDVVNDYLFDIESLRLDWCNMKTFPKKQWLAENELALARIIPFVYAQFFLQMQLPDRNFTTSTTMVAIQQMFHSMHLMICVLMSPRDSSAEEIDRHVKLFLSCCHRFSRSYYEKDETPFWADTGNFPTLLCLAEQRRRHGPIRLYWEGTSERFIQTLKGVLSSMRKTTAYFSRKMTLLYKMNVMDWLQSEFNRSASGEDAVRRQGRMYYQYLSLDEIVEKIELGEVISGFTLDGSNKLFVSYGSQQRSGFTNCVEIIRMNKGHSRKCLGFAYVKVCDDIDVNVVEEISVKNLERQMKNYFLLLPLVENNEFNQFFAVVYDDWDVGDEDFDKCLPKVCGLCFETDVGSM